MIKILTLLCMMFMPIMANADAPQIKPEERLAYAAFTKNLSEVQSAIRDGATNVNYVFRQELESAKKNFCTMDFDILKELLDAQDQLLSHAQADDFIYQAIYYNCINDNDPQCSKKKSFNIKTIIGISSWSYKVSEKLLEKIASIATNHDDKLDVIVCVFDQVSKGKLAGVEFMDIAGRVADTQNAANTKAIINSLRDEIDRKRNEQ